jgi:hypothetical protein
VPSELDEATDAADYLAKTLTITEVQTASVDEVERQTNETSRNDALAATLLVKVWDATLDSRVCPVCSRKDGEWVLIGMRFSEGKLPAYVHRRCRCSSELLPIRVVSEIANARLF